MSQVSPSRQAVNSPQIELHLADTVARLQSLASTLDAGRSIWDIRSFDYADFPWQQGFPSLARALNAIDDDAIDALDKDQQALVAALLPALESDVIATGAAPWSRTLFDWTLPDNPLDSLKDEAPYQVQSLLPSQRLSRFSAGIKGRKWEQISRFVAITAASSSALPVLEWCAGKGHLGRLMGAVTQMPVVSLELQQSLCEAGTLEADKRAVKQRFVCADAFGDTAHVFDTNQHALALHACGELHLTLLRNAVAAGTRAISISPCCYHLFASGDYGCVSDSARSTGLRLSRSALQLPLNHALVAGEKANADRLKEVSWRLGFDSLQRLLRACDEYLPLPTIRQSQLSGEFEDFCRWAADYRGLTLPEAFNASHWLAEGRKRQWLTRRLDLAAHLFRPLIEQFLLLDRAAFLLEAGYRVNLSAFCAPQVTPRNALIEGRR
ncbi:methyltransferase [Shewanella sp.]|uniref:methyltransferase n=1 Tax=Shewanella sp. TaxID=50422 RepID=UPI00356AC76B